MLVFFCFFLFLLFFSPHLHPHSSQPCLSHTLSPTSISVVPRGLEQRTLRLLAVRSNQLSYESACHAFRLAFVCMYCQTKIHNFVFFPTSFLKGMLCCSFFTTVLWQVIDLAIGAPHRRFVQDHLQIKLAIYGDGFKFH